MSRILLLLCLSMLVPDLALAQDSCPMLTINGPDRIVNVGDIASYRASLDLKKSRGTPTFRWTVSVGEILTGQGTNTIEVRQSNDGCITATVEVGGFPDSCPLIASESSCGLPPPEPVKIGEMRNIEEAGAVIKQFAAELENNPNNQGYVFVGHPSGTSQPQMYAREQSIRDAVRKADPDNFDDSRITITAVERSADVVGFWRVPPGANNPTCETCKPPQKVDCPLVEIVGPSSLTTPGDIAVFSLKNSLKKPDLADFENLKFRWEISRGTIEDGQYTPKISVRANTDQLITSITATLKIAGLPHGCPSSASETVGVAANVDYFPIDDYERLLGRNEDLGRLDMALHQINQHPSFQFLFVLNAPAKSSTASLSSRKRRIVQHLVNVRKFSMSRIHFIRRESDRISTAIYMLPPDLIKPMSAGDPIVP